MGTRDGITSDLAGSSAAERATAPARWLLDAAADGVGLTQKHALARVVVREAAERWPDWWDAELFGPPHREADLAVLTELHQGLKRLRLVRRRGRRLYSTVRGKDLSRDPGALLAVLAEDLGGGEEFIEAVAAEVVDLLEAADSATWEELDAAALLGVTREGWRLADGRPLGDRDAGWAVGEVLRRGEAYGLIERHPDLESPRRLGSRIALSDGGRFALDAQRPGTPGLPASAGLRALVFDAELVGVPGVGARLAIGEGQHLTDLHYSIQAAFGWGDDHLYSFWLDGAFWGEPSTEFTTPQTPDEGKPTAGVPLAELDLSVGKEIAYVFDFGDEWRVLLRLAATEPADGGEYPRVLQLRGTPPPQYPDLDED